MVFSKRGKVLSLSIFCVLAVIALAGSSQAQMMNSVAGKITATYTMQDSTVVGPGHNLMMSTSSGTNASTGEAAFMDGAECTNRMIADMNMGSGSHQGYLTMKKDGNSVLIKWSGSVATKMMEGQPPMTSFAGNFTYVSGTGKFEGIMGEGTYKGAFTSKTDYSVEWQGSYHIMMKK